MIGHISGSVHSVGEDTAIVLAGGVGYEVQAAPRLLARLRPGEPAALAVETLVAETYIRLVAFETETERRAFRLLQSVQGVGAKAALNILQVLTPTALLDAVAMQDKAAVARAQGVGPKLAQRIVTELKGKTAGIAGGGSHEALAETLEDDAPPAGARADAVAALIGLGFDEGRARAAVLANAEAAGDSVEALIAASLKSLAR